MDSHDRRHFLSLPPEIRLQIYKYTLICNNQIKPERRRGRGDSTIAAPLLRTCKQIYHEAAPVLYSGNTFLIDYPKLILDWFKAIGPQNIGYLERLRIFVSADYGQRDKLEKR